MLKSIFFIFACTASLLAESLTRPGLLAEFGQPGKQVRDALVLPQPALFIREGAAPSRFIEPGEFTVELRGWVSVELRAQYTFQARLSGRLELSINGKPVLEATGQGELSPLSKPIRLNRGTNSLVAKFTPPGQGDAQLQLLWTSKALPFSMLIPTEALSYDATDKVLATSSVIRRGAELFADFRCASCHFTPGQSVNPSAPDFSGIGSRLNPDWIAHQVATPSPPHMPALFAPGKRTANASAIASYLSTLRGDTPEVVEGDKGRGETLFRDLLCGRCHLETTADLSLAHIREKFAPGALAEYLQDPRRHYAANPMPNFQLSRSETADLSAFLANRSSTVAPMISGFLESGRELVQTSGCLNCHTLNLQNRFSAPALSEIRRKPNEGCLAKQENRAPRFPLDLAERQALSEFLRVGSAASFSREGSIERALHQTAQLRCVACHDQTEGVPKLTLLGAKLKPRWTKQFIDGGISYKPRPWLKARMPSFTGWGASLAEGLAALTGEPPVAPEEPPIDHPQAEIGARLVSAAGGFSCVACHAVGTFSSGQVVETPGLNLAHSGERLLESYFHRWVMNPVALDPSTKMPVYFDAEGRSQLTEFFDGDGNRQINAIWEYIRLGEKMPPPSLP